MLIILKYNISHAKVITATSKVNCGEPKIQALWLNYAAGYYPYGKTLREWNVGSEDFGYQSSQKDKEKGTYYTLYRALDAEIARWHQYDPKATPFESPYTSMANNPVMYNDVLGDCPTCPKDAQEGDTYYWGGAMFTYSDGQWATNLTAFTINGNENEISWTSEAEQWDYYSDYTHYQTDYSEFSGMSQSEAKAFWEEHYSEIFFKEWFAGVKRERDREVVSKMAWFIQAIETESFVIGPVTGLNSIKSLSINKRFNYTPRGINSKNTSTSLVTKYPTNPSISGTTKIKFLMPGKIIDRYGSLKGYWFSEPSVSYGARSIPPGLSPYTKFRVLKPFEVRLSISSPGMFHGQSGFGLQYKSLVNARTLIKKGIISPIK